MKQGGRREVMSLVGNLEDLGLGDILQIVSLSRKSGTLSLNSMNREGKIVFLHGQVIQATSSVFRENLGDMLTRREMVDLATLKRALSIQRFNAPDVRLGVILAENFGVSRDAIEEVVREQVEKIVYSFFGWREGTFAFELGQPDSLATTNLDPLQFMLDQGLNPQWLAMEGSRILDEKRHRGEPLESEGEESRVDVATLFDGSTEAVSGAVETETPGAVGPRTLFLVDDDEMLREELATLLERQGCSVRRFASAEQCLPVLEATVSDGGRPELVVDLIMPRLDGSGILGGIELLQTVRERFSDLMVQMISDHPNEEAARQALALGVPTILAKPKKGDLQQETGRQALEELAGRLIARQSSVDPPPAAAVHYDIGAELLREMGEAAPTGSGAKGPESPGLHLLKGMLQELQNPALGGGVLLLVLRFASELMNRAVVFLVRGGEVVGHGAFGLESSTEGESRVRSLRIPLDEDSVFQRLLTEKVSFHTQLGNGHWDMALCRQLGGGEPEEVFLGPILSDGEVVAVIYGDNLPEQRGVGDTEALEIFLSQAGLALEKSHLEKRLKGQDAI